MTTLLIWAFCLLVGWVLLSVANWLDKKADETAARTDFLIKRMEEITTKPKDVSVEFRIKGSDLIGVLRKQGGKDGGYDNRSV